MASTSIPSGNNCLCSYSFSELSPQRILQWFRREPENQRAADVALYMSLMNNARRRVQQGMARHSMAKLAFEKQTLLEHSDVETAYALSAPSMAGVGPVSGLL